MTAPPVVEVGPLVHVSEVFGPTIQGEGPYAGRCAMFVRLGGCNLTCRGCDTPYTWDGRRFNLRQEITPLPAGEVVFQVVAKAGAVNARPTLVVITGGEPLLHQHTRGFRAMVEGLLASEFELIQFETNGTLAPADWLVDEPRVVWVVSPKLAGPLATDPEQRRVVPEVLDRYAELARGGRAWFKVVVSSALEVDYATQLTVWHRVPRQLVYVMPAGTTVEEVVAGGQEIADAACRDGLSVSTRLHLLLWPGEDRGR